MATCPHCGSDGIHLLRKWWSDSAAPASCPACGGLSYVSICRKDRIRWTSAVFFLVFLGLAVVLNRPWLILAGALTSVAAYLYLWRRLPLVPTNAENAAEVRWWGWGFVIIIGLLVALLVFWAARNGA